MRILIASAELAPHASAGSTGHAVGALASALADLGHAVCVALPAYAGLAGSRVLDPEPAGSAIDLPLGAAAVRTSFLHATDPRGFEIFLVDAPGLLDRDGIYGDGRGDYPDNPARFLLFSKAVVELARRLRPTPEHLLLHDWPAAPAAAFARAARIGIPTVLTLHGTAWQGHFGSQEFALTNLGPEWFTPEAFEFHGGINFLKAGILSADSVTLPSTVEFQNVLRPGGGCGLEGPLRAKGAALRVVQHGPIPVIPAKRARGGKRPALADFGLAPDPAGPVFLLPGPDSTAMELLAPALDRLLADDVRLLITGSPPDNHRAPLEVALRKYPGKIARVDPEDPAAPYAVADFGFAIGRPAPDAAPLPALLAAGLPVIGRAAPGLHPLARDFDPSDPRGWAFLFYRDSPEALYDAVRRAKRAWTDPELRKEVSARASKHAPSWTGAATALLDAAGAR